MTPSRRRFLESSAVAAVALGAGALSIVPAAAQGAFDLAEMMKPGPLPEMTLGKPDAAVTVIEYSSMTCGHCAGAVTTELKGLDGVSDVDVDLVAGGTSTVTVTSEAPLDEAKVAEALDEAGDYKLA